MNGIDPVVVATGNDWRAIEAGAHAYAASSGRYRTPFSLRASRRAGSGSRSGRREGSEKGACAGRCRDQ
eukprot:3618505-Rhodomonas_salina.1